MFGRLSELCLATSHLSRLDPDEKSYMLNDDPGQVYCYFQRIGANNFNENATLRKPYICQMQQQADTPKQRLAFTLLIIVWCTVLCCLTLVRFGSALDAHWTTAWPALLGLIVVGLITRLVSLSSKVLWILAPLAVLLLVQGYLGSESYAEDGLLLLSFLVILSIRPTVVWREQRITVIIISSLWLLFSILLMGLLVANASQFGYTHESTYAIKPLFAHRNIAIESYTLWSVAAFALLGSRRLRWLLLLVTTAVIVVYQVRTALIGVALFIVIEFVRNFRQFRWFKWLLAAGCVALIALQLTFSFLRTPAQKHRFDALPDLVKNLDVSYNLTRAESSSERLIMWRWTAERLTLEGQGIGSWKFMAEGHVNAALGKCNLMVRHPHSDILKMAYETGVLWTLVFIIWWVVVMRPPLKYIAVFLPMFIFAFPTERGETLSALMVLLLSTGAPVKDEQRLGKIPALVLCTVLLILSLCWSRSQYLLGKAMRDPLVLKQTSTADRKMLDAFPFDIVLNRLPTYQAIVLADAGQPEAAKALLSEILIEHPNDQGALRLMQRLGGELPPNVVVCDSLTTQP